MGGGVRAPQPLPPSHLPQGEGEHPAPPASFPHKKRRQKHGNRRKQRHHQQHRQQRDKPRQHRARQQLITDLGNPRGHKQHHPNRRINRPQHQIEYHQNTELHRRHAKRYRHRQQDRHQDQHPRQRLQETPNQQQDQIAHQQKCSGAMDRGHHHRRQRLRHLGDRHAPAQRASRHHQRRHDADRFDGINQDLRDIGRVQRAVDHQPQQQRIARRDRGGLGRREQPAEHAGQQDDRRHHRQESITERPRQLRPAGEVLAREPLALADHHHHRHQRCGHQQARNDPGQEQPPHRGIRRDAVDHHRHARRHDGTHGGRRRIDRRRRLRPVPRTLHRADLDRAGAGRVGDGRTRHAGEDQARQNAGLRIAAAQRAHHRRGEAHNAIRDARRAHHVAHEDEQRRRNERKRVHRLRHLLRHDSGGQARQQHESQRRQTHCGKQRHAGEDDEQPRRADLDHQGGQWIFAPMSGSAGRFRCHTASAAACSAINNAAGISGMYSHTIETGSEVASSPRLLRNMMIA